MFVYLISRIDPSCHQHNERIAALISQSGEHQVFIPHRHNPCDIAHDALSLDVFHEDVSAMQRSHIGCVAFPIRCDCSSEVGWYSGAQKPVVGIIADTGSISCMDQYQSIKDNWMVKGFLSAVIIIGCHKTQDACEKDPILKNKITFLHDASNLHRILAMTT